MAELLKTETLMVRNQELPNVTVFQSIQDEEGDRVHILSLDRRVWVDLGSPDEITVTIKPGDMLNAPTTKRYGSLAADIPAVTRNTYEGEPCPVCGSPNHTVHENGGTPVDPELQRLLDEEDEIQARREANFPGSTARDIRDGAATEKGRGR